MSRILTGRDALDAAREHSVTLYKYADPVEGPRSGLTLLEAEAIIEEDPGLVYCELPEERKRP